MQKILEIAVKERLKTLITEQSMGEWDDETIEKDVEFFFEGLKDFFPT